MSRLIFLTLAIFISVSSFSQKNVKGTEGVYINNEGKAITAMFTYQNPNRNVSTNTGIKPGTIFLYEGNKLKEKLTAEDVLYVIPSYGDTLKSIEINQKIFGKVKLAREFAKKKIEGRLDLYYISLTTIRAHGSTRGDVACINIEGEDYFISFMQPKKAKKRFIELIADNEKMSSDVEEMGTFEFLKDIEKTVEEYNSWAEKQE